MRDHSRTSDEFAPEVAAAIARIRAEQGIDSPDCPEQTATATGSGLFADVDRRSFLKLSGAAAVFALAACHKDPDTLVPHRSQPEGSVLGKPRTYASVLRASGRPVSVLVKTYDARPIKLEGNPDCPIGKGAADLRTQAALLDLYDPNRLRGPVERKGSTYETTTWSNLDAAVAGALKAGDIGLVTPPIDGPARRSLIDAMVTAFAGRLRHAVYDPTDSGVQAEFAGEAFGVGAAMPTWHLDRAKVFLHLGGDFLADQGLAGQVAFGAFRRGDGTATGQIIAIEPVLSQTGTVADVRVRCAGDRLAWFAWAVADLIAAARGITLPEAAMGALGASRKDGFDKALDLRAIPVAESQRTALQEATAAAKLPSWTGDSIPATTYSALRLLQAGPGASLVYAGGPTHDSRGSAALVSAVHWLNAALGNCGRTVTFDRPASAIRPGDQGVGWAALREACASGQVKTLITVGVNPAYADPAAAAALAKVPMVVAIADRLDETARRAIHVAPALHDLENWGDAELAPGVLAIQQPAIRPLWDARSSEESLMAWTVAALGAAAPSTFVQAVQPDPADLSDQLSVVERKPLWRAGRAGVQSWRDYVRTVWTAAGIGWIDAVATGVTVRPAPAGAPPAHAGKAVAPATWLPKTTMQAVVTVSRTLGPADGAAANNPWLLETPDPVSRITWDPYVAIAADDAAGLGLDENAVASITLGGITADLPVHIQDGQHPGTIEVFAGWGRALGCAGDVADLGRDQILPFNAFALPARIGLKVDVGKPTGRRFVLACPQGHDRQEGRDIARERILGVDAHQGHHAAWLAGVDGKVGGRLSVHGQTIPVDGNKWGMSVDLSLCTGCNACTVACSAENNVPVVGRDEVRRGRIMHWIRIDRYYTGKDRNDVEVVHQPLMCQQCDKAPCEAVCPANATMHNESGLNVQIYNRCIGTRYCANNCPYKARRFNWYEYTAYRAGPATGGDFKTPLTRIVRNLVNEGHSSAAAELTHQPLLMMLNPEVTVRSRGVMEKCNFCLQRTRAYKDRSRTEGRLADGAFTTACAQTCPTKALVFGDLNDPASQVSRLSAIPGGYKVLDEELNTRPAVTYQPRLRSRPASQDEAASGKQHQEGA